MPFVWDEGDLEHIAVHGVEAGEAEEALLDKRALIFDVPESGGEQRFARLGPTADGALLFVVFTLRLRAGVQYCRVVTARPASPKEKRKLQRR